jgi:hypothetical protein
VFASSSILIPRTLSTRYFFHEKKGRLDEVQSGSNLMVGSTSSSIFFQSGSNLIGEKKVNLHNRGAARPFRHLFRALFLLWRSFLVPSRRLPTSQLFTPPVVLLAG